MDGIIQCRKCNTAVLPMSDGRCPACLQRIPEVTPAVADQHQELPSSPAAQAKTLNPSKPGADGRDGAIDQVKRGLLAGHASEALLEDLIQHGWNLEDSQQILRHVQATMSVNPERQRAWANMKSGCLTLVGLFGVLIVAYFICKAFDTDLDHVFGRGSFVVAFVMLGALGRFLWGAFRWVTSGK